MLIERPAELLPWRFPHGANNTGPFAAWLRPSTLWLLVALYVLHKPLLRRALKCKALPMSRGLTAAIAVHNLGLAVYSAVTLYHTMSAVVGHYRSRGFEAVYCDADHAMWDGTPFGWWATLFYVSKFYEFLDTTVLILKGKEPSFLQVYHHVGIVIFLWGSSVTKSAWVVWPTLLNSFIHTLMYSYFTAATLGVKIPYARYLTTAQIVQFVLGIAISSPVLYLGEACASAASRLVLLGIQAYAWGLVALFSAFFSRKYKAK